ncbi:MAG: hypothetical protein HN855_02880 [Anaerolineae bacterium]|jgi:hypothetical protein|nr:hypothetical protein [Anaerolineae bacterium]MBT7073177.1 hypothetical protein [Anaerolineae bacterium]MBT7324082.1 hypothetical protein [Anaerolineae bacterium]
MKKDKTFGFSLLIAGSILSGLSLLFLPISIYGAYLLLSIYKPAMSKAVRIVLGIVIALIIAFGLATIVSVMLY